MFLTLSAQELSSLHAVGLYTNNVATTLDITVHLSISMDYTVISVLSEALREAVMGNTKVLQALFHCSTASL